MIYKGVINLDLSLMKNGYSNHRGPEMVIENLQLNQELNHIEMVTINHQLKPLVSAMLANDS